MHPAGLRGEREDTPVGGVLAFSLGRRAMRTFMAPEQPLSGADRWHQLRRCIRDPQLRPRLRVAGALVSLYGATDPVSRIVAMRTRQIEEYSTGVYLAIGEHRTLLPPALADLVIRLRDAAPPASIFGPSQHTSRLALPRPRSRPASRRQLLVRQLNAGIRTRIARNGALISLAADVPAPILADLLGLHINTAVRWVRRSDETGPATSRRAQKRRLPIASQLAQARRR